MHLSVIYIGNKYYYISYKPYSDWNIVVYDYILNILFVNYKAN